MAEAVQVVVRGFKSQPSGNMIVSRLEGAGFSIKEKWECGCDGCRGGSIETEITTTDQLACAIEADSFKDINTDITVLIKRYEEVDA